MGYFGYSYYAENQDKLKALQIQNPKTGTCVTPSIARRRTTRTSRWHVRCSSTRRVAFKRKEVQAFIDYIFDNEVKIATSSVRAADEGAAQAGEDQLRPRREGRRQDLSFPFTDLPASRSGRRPLLVVQACAGVRRRVS